MQTRDLDSIIAAHPFFADFPAPYLALVTGCAKTASFAANEALFREDVPADWFFLVRHGHVAIQVHSPTHGRFTLDTVGPGEILGWSWLVPPYRYEFDAIAHELTRCIAFDGACLRAKCEADPAMGFDLLKRFSAVMTQRLRATRARLLDIYNIAR